MPMPAINWSAASKRWPCGCGSKTKTRADLARFLQSHPAVGRVIYPGLPDHPDHAIAARQMRGFGGMLSFELRQPSQVDRLLAGLQLATPALSLGGVETLVTVPSRTSHRTMSPEERRSAGISDGLVRVSVGIEDIDDLTHDFDQALRGLTRTARLKCSAGTATTPSARSIWQHR